MIIPIPGVPSDYVGAGKTISSYQIEQLNKEQNKFNAQEAATQRKWSADQAALTRSFNAQEASKQRSWEAQMSNSAHTREVADLRAAGLNPVLSANSGASTPSAAAASASSPSGSSASGSSASGALASYLSSIISAQASIENTRVNAEASRYASELMAQVNRYAAQMSFAGTQYSANMNYRNQAEQREWQAYQNELTRSLEQDYPKSVPGIAQRLYEGWSNDHYNPNARGAEKLGQDAQKFVSGIRNGFLTGLARSGIQSSKANRSSDGRYNGRSGKF